MGTSSATTRIACAQLAPVVADPAGNRRLADRAIRAAARSGAQVIVLPELTTTGYYLELPEAADLAEDAAGASVTAWIEALAGSTAVLVGGFCERGSDGNVYNSAAMVSSDGLLSVYRKTHLWAREPRLFTPGGQPPPVVDTCWGPIGMAICYDLFFPEVTRGLALGGAWLLAVPTNSPFDGPRAPGARGRLAASATRWRAPPRTSTGFTLPSATGTGTSEVTRGPRAPRLSAPKVSSSQDRSATARSC